MRTPYQKIINNQTTNAEFRGCSFDDEFITQIAHALEQNTSVQTISFDGSHIHDKQLEILVESLIRVGRKRQVLNLDNTEHTKGSLPILEKLIKSKIIGSIFLFATDDLYESEDSKALLQKLGTDNGVRVSFLSRTKRQALGIFDKVTEEKSSEFSSPEDNLSSDDEKDGKMTPR